MNPELPFERRGGDDQMTAIHNRAAALARIKFLSGVDLKDKTAQYKMLIDAEMYNRWYKDLPMTPIDEDWCQRASDVIKELESKDKKDLEVIESGAEERVQQLFNEAKHRPHIPVESKVDVDLPVEMPVSPKESWWAKIKKNFKKD